MKMRPTSFAARHCFEQLGFVVHWHGLLGSLCSVFHQCLWSKRGTDRICAPLLCRSYTFIIFHYCCFKRFCVFLCVLLDSLQFCTLTWGTSQVVIGDSAAPSERTRVWIPSLDEGWFLDEELKKSFWAPQSTASLLRCFLRFCQEWHLWDSLLWQQVQCSRLACFWFHKSTLPSKLLALCFDSTACDQLCKDVHVQSAPTNIGPTSLPEIMARGTTGAPPSCKPWHFLVLLCGLVCWRRCGWVTYPPWRRQKAAPLASGCSWMKPKIRVTVQLKLDLRCHCRCPMQRERERGRECYTSRVIGFHISYLSWTSSQLHRKVCLQSQSWWRWKDNNDEGTKWLSCHYKLSLYRVYICGITGKEIQLEKKLVWLSFGGEGNSSSVFSSADLDRRILRIPVRPK